MPDKIRILKCMAVDDEPLSLEVLEKYVADTHFLRLECTAENAIQASELLHLHNIDLIFLDINMPKLSGIQFLKSLRNIPLVIFTTAYPDYALEGFELDAVDYLLKPFSFERFLKAVNKARAYREQDHTNGKEVESYIFIKSDKRLHKIPLNDISWLESAGDYVKIHGLSNLLLTHDTLKNLEERLDNDMFIRIHKSFIINKHKIEYIEGNRIRISGEYIPIGLSYKQKFYDTLDYS